MLPGIIFVEQPAAPALLAPDPGRTAYGLWWEGWDGSNWALSTDTSGIILMRGVRGLGRITEEHHRDEHASIAGSRWRDARALNREVFLPLHVYAEGDSQAWVDHHRAFARTMRKGKTGWLHIVHPNGHHRRLECRYERGMEEAYELDPAFFGWATYGVYLTAEQPYWEGVKPVQRRWGAAPPVYFFGGGTEGPTAGPPFGIAASNQIDDAQVTNESDEEVFAIWRLSGTGPTSLEINGEVIEVPFSVPAEETLTIDMRPEFQIAYLSDGTDVTGDLGTFDFSPIQPDELTKLGIEVTGNTGDVSLEFTPLYEWGVS